ncbi:MAG: hypothetical protein KAG66_10935, partial [Methylococcales bacterium]|nr:hypothetical protein [Methylococcales bacterium]
ALFFSLLGALGHLCKLCFLSVKGIGLWLKLDNRWLRFAWAVPAAIFIGAWSTLSLLQNEVTHSRLYAYLEHQINQNGNHTSQSLAGLNILHVVAVGQGYFYPYNEKIRTGLLGNITFGYTPPRKAVRT